MNVLADNRWSDFKLTGELEKGRRLEMRAQPSNTPDSWEIKAEVYGESQFEIITENMRTWIHVHGKNPGG